MNQAASGLGEAGRRQLQSLLERIARIAVSVKPWARRFTLLGTLGAAWLAWVLHGLTDSSLWVTGLILFVLMLPALVCGWLWWLLIDVAELPEVAERTLGLMRRRGEPGPEDAGVSDVFTMGGSLRQAASLAWEIESLHSVIVGVMVLANPLFLLVLGVAIVASTGLGLIGIAGLLLGAIF